MNTDKDTKSINFQDISPHRYEIGLADIETFAPKKRAAAKFEWPLFLRWLNRSVGGIMDPAKFKEILELTEEPDVPLIYLGRLLERAVELYFSRNFYETYSHNSGMAFFVSVSNKCRVASSKEKAILFHDFMKTFNNTNVKKVHETLMILSYYIKDVKPMINLFLCAKMEKSELSPFFRDMKYYIREWDEKKELDEVSSWELLSAYDTFKNENLE
ncbi:hypothetical protein B5S29_g2555 [[Candida] boidinii]|uniref:Unnamed protein product n=1 Tax=Candida boidinii TaxID=5477 RepID=A0ACB5TJD1_CANBO|nr:hypothetical protein B5S29_g2555 [[Candida] boidinii]GME89421.1 unnamed protein product [[Candida] boidinii]